MNQQFLAWLTSHYGGMFNYPASTPLMVHHIPGFIAHQLAHQQCQRAAFILVDGLAIDQWLILKEGLKAQGITAPIEENALFAWIPTVTPISRQAAFGGKIPRYFAETLLRTDRDEARWRQFWADRGFAPGEIGFAASPGDHSDLSELAEALTPQTRALGITLYKVDKIMHGMQLGRLGMAGQVQTWCEGGFLAKLLHHLRELHFDVFISSDHGNTEGVGLGKPQEGVLSEKRGERCRVYSDPVFQKSCRAAFPEVVPFDHGGLPENISSLLAPYGKAFTQEGATIVCHGGAALEEVCVPFIHIAR